MPLVTPGLPPVTAADATRPSPHLRYDPAMWFLLGGPVLAATLQIPAGTATVIPAPAGPDWTGAAALVVPMGRSCTDDSVVVLEVQVMDRRGGWHWRKHELDCGPVHDVRIPLGTFRDGAWGHQPRWDQVGRVAIHARDEATLEVGTARLEPGEGPYPYLPDPQVLIDAGWPEGAKVRVEHQPHVIVVTDDPRVDAATLDERAAAAQAMLAALLPSLPAPLGPPILVLSAEDESWRKALVGAAAAAASTLSIPDNDGFSVLGIAGTSWHPESGQERPVVVHELTHAIVRRTGGIPEAPGSWLQEGIATWVKLRLQPQEGLDDDVRRWLPGVDSGELWAVVDGRRLGTRSYWIATTVIDMLTQHPDYAPRREALLDALARSRDPDLGALVGPLYGVDRPRFESDWRAWVTVNGAP